MKKVLLFGFLVIVLASGVFADISVEKEQRGNVVVQELMNPAVFHFTITNTGENDTYEIYSLVDVRMGPRGFFTVPSGETELDVWAYVGEDLRSTLGLLTFEYQMKGRKQGIFRDRMVVEIVPFTEVLAVSSEPFGPDDGSIGLTLKNLENTHLESIELAFDSIFFTGERTVSLKPYEEVNITLPLNRAPDRASAGAYLFSVGLAGRDETAVEGTLQFLEKSLTSTEELSEGAIVRKTTITKTNDGNIPVTARIEIEKDIISRLFTLHSEEPAETIRDGLSVTYIWEHYVRPGESFSVESTSNYTIPFILLLVIVIGGFLVRFYSMKSLSIKKRVSPVRTKHGELALKVTLKVTARAHVDNAQLIDSLPAMTKLYEHFGKKPDKVEVHSRRLFWQMGDLDKGESRVYSYILYSKLNVVGRFELPAALGLFTLKGETREVRSNRAFYARE